MRDKKRLWTLFTGMLTISSFTFGGGFVIVGLMKRRFVDELGWLTEEEMLDLTAMAQSSPGAIAVNAAALAGSRVAGWPGLAAAVLGTVLPPVVLLSLLSLCYGVFRDLRPVRLALAGMQAGVAAVILDVAWGLGEKVLRGKDPLGLAMMVLGFAAGRLFKVSAAVLVPAAAAVGLARGVVRLHRQKGGRA